MEEDFASSKLAADHGISRYPAFFVDRDLFAGPTDFYAWGKDVQPKFGPWSETEKREQFQAELEKYIRARLSGEEASASRPKVAARPVDAVVMPDFALADLAGERMASSDLAGKVSMIEFWATWCVPCKRTVPWLAEAAKRYAGRAEVLSIALTSPEDKVRAYAAGFDSPMRWVIADEALEASFGPVTALPTLYVFDAEQRLVGTFIGAAPDVHVKLQRLLSKLLPTELDANAPSAGKQIEAELAELRALAENLPAEQQQRVSPQLDAVDALLAEDRIYAAVAALMPPAVDIRGFSYVQTVAAGIEDLESFTAHWQKVSDRMYAEEESFEAMSSAGAAALQGMAELARAAARPYAESARLYAEVDSLDSGLFYLGRAQGQLRYASFCRSLNVLAEGSLEASLDPASIIAAVEAETQSLFSSSSDVERKDRALLVLNSNLKTAHSLLKDGRRMGAIYQGLRVRLQLASIVQRDRQRASGDELLLALEDALEALDLSEGDSSLARLFCEEAGSVLEREEPAAEDLLAAKIILDELLPMLRERRKGN